MVSLEHVDTMGFISTMTLRQGGKRSSRCPTSEGLARQKLVLEYLRHVIDENLPPTVALNDKTYH